MNLEPAQFTRRNSLSAIHYGQFVLCLALEKIYQEIYSEF